MGNIDVTIPYLIDTGQPIIIPEKTLKEKYPHTYEYLTENRPSTTNRSHRPPDGQTGLQACMNSWMKKLRS